MLQYVSRAFLEIGMNIEAMLMHHLQKLTNFIHKAVHMPYIEIIKV